MAKHIKSFTLMAFFVPLHAGARVCRGQHLTLILPENGAELEPFVEDEDLRKWVPSGQASRCPA